MAKGPRRYKKAHGSQVTAYYEEEYVEIPEVQGEAKIKYIMIDCPNRDELVSVTKDKIMNWDWNEDGNIVSLVIMCICGKSHVLTIEEN